MPTVGFLVRRLAAGKFAHTGYHDPFAREARARIITFFDRHLAD